MFNETEFIARLESADTDAFAGMLLSAANGSGNEESLLRHYFGKDLYQRLRGLAMRLEQARQHPTEHEPQNVVVIPGMLGSQLSLDDGLGKQVPLWFNLDAIADGQLKQLRLAADGRNESDNSRSVQATGIFKRYYGELLLTLAPHCNVHAFWYDWRKDFELAESELKARIDGWFDRDESVTIIAHGVGGLVARWYLDNNWTRWRQLKNGRGSQLIMLGTPNHGSFVSPLMLAGLPYLFRWVDQVDNSYTLQSYRSIVSSFPSVYQCLPSPSLLADSERSKMEALTDKIYDVNTYGAGTSISKQHLESAKLKHNELLTSKTANDAAWLLQFVGYNQPTVVGLPGINKFDEIQQNAARATTAAELHELVDGLVEIGPDGDGFSQVQLAELLPEKVPTIYVKENLGSLQSNRAVLNALIEILAANSRQQAGPKSTHSSRRPDYEEIIDRLELQTRRPRADEYLAENKFATAGHSLDLFSFYDRELKKIRRGETKKEENRRQYLKRIVRQSRGNKGITEIDETKQAVTDLLTQNQLNSNGNMRGLRIEIPFKPPSIKIDVIGGDYLELADVDGKPFPSTIDSIAIGHYLNSKPLGLVGKLDKKISDVAHNQIQLDTAGEVEDERLILSQYTERGILKGELAQLFFMPDPRQLDRLLAIVGMGTPGRYREPQMRVVARELCWSIGRMGKKHLAVVLIGTRQNNLPLVQAASGWIHGIKHAITGEDSQKLERITFIVGSSTGDAEKKAFEFSQHIDRHVEELRKKERMEINWGKKPIDPKAVEADTGYSRSARARSSAWANSSNTQYDDDYLAGEDTPTRIFVQQTANAVRFGAMTHTASIPERNIPMDPRLIAKANDELTYLNNIKEQINHGQFMEQLLIPNDFHEQLMDDGPVVMMVDRETAKVQWEMLAHSEGMRSTPDENADSDFDSDGEELIKFWGIGRGLTRQLRTEYAPPPEFPPPDRRILRALVIADPAADAPLPGAQREGHMVADLLERFNTVHGGSANRIEVVRLFGPREATTTTVLKHLTTRTYDILHFAGHSDFDEDDPMRSGWVFSDGERLTAYEFDRVDRVPLFVFSNSCESGVTSFGKTTYDLQLAPSFAEAFFKQGVSDFVCTAWPVNDEAALEFALKLYAGLLNMECTSGNTSNIDAYRAGSNSIPMYKAMREARKAIARMPYDMRTWGAYQHYGNPNFRLFSHRSLCAPATASNATSQSVPSTASSSQGSPDGAQPSAGEDSWKFDNDVTISDVIERPRQLGTLKTSSPIELDKPLPDRIENVTPFIEVRTARTTFNVTGKEQRVAVLDTGINGTHRDFAGRIVEGFNFTGDNNSLSSDVTDGLGHGTNVSGIIAANDVHVGMAPDAEIVPLKVIKNDSSVSFWDVRRGLKWLLEKLEADENFVSVVCMSLSDHQNYQNLSQYEERWDKKIEGGEGFAKEKKEFHLEIVEQIRELHKRNIPVVVAAGNQYGAVDQEANNKNHGMGFPAVVAEAVSVGAVFDSGPTIRDKTYDRLDATVFKSEPDQITPFSQRLHKSVDPQHQTTIFAPGAAVIATGIRGNDTSSKQNGTSQAAPVTAGVILLMQEFYRKRMGKLPPVHLLVDCLREGGEVIEDLETDNDSVQNTGEKYVRINALNALSALKRALENDDSSGRVHVAADDGPFSDDQGLALTQPIVDTPPEGTGAQTPEHATSSNGKAKMGHILGGDSPNDQVV